MPDKTKAALQGRQCHYQKLKQSQDTRVNAGGQSLSAPVITGTAALAQLGGMSKSGRTQKGYKNFLANLQTTWKLLCLGCSAMQHTPQKSRSFDRYPDIEFQLLGSMPRCFNSLRTIRLSHAERVASPSSCMAATIASSSAGSTRKAICLLPLGIFMFDMCLTLGVIFVVSRNVHHVSDTCKARSPAVLPALTGPLTINRYTR